MRVMRVGGGGSVEGDGCRERGGNLRNRGAGRRMRIQAMSVRC